MDVVRELIPLGFLFLFAVIILWNWRFALVIAVLGFMFGLTINFEALSEEDGSGRSLDTMMNSGTYVDTVIYGLVGVGFLVIVIVQVISKRRRRRAPTPVMYTRPAAPTRVALGQWLTDKDEAARYAPLSPLEGEPPIS